MTHKMLGIRVNGHDDDIIVWEGAATNAEVKLNHDGTAELIIIGPEPIPRAEQFTTEERTYDEGVNYTTVYVIDSWEFDDVEITINDVE